MCTLVSIHSYLYILVILLTIENFLCKETIICWTVWLERTKINLDIFSVWFIFHLINEIDTTTFQIFA